MIRRARLSDFGSIEEIGRMTWGGRDYLPSVFHEWLEDGSFFVLEVDGSAVATAKLTLLPCGVGWMEGLRVHPSHRGRGYASKLHDFLISYGEELHRIGKISSLMYATDSRNEASIHLGLKSGFSVVKRFYHLFREAGGCAEVREAEPLLPELDLIPVGWRFIRRCEESLEWLRGRVRAFRMNEGGFFVPREADIFTPSDYSRTEDLLEGMGSVAAGLGRRLGIMIPEDLPDLAGRLRGRGFSQREGDEPDVLVFELKL